MKLDYYGVAYRIHCGIVVLFEDTDHNTYFLDYLRYRIDDTFRAVGYLDHHTVTNSEEYNLHRFLKQYEFMIELADMVLPQTPGGDQC